MPGLLKRVELYATDCTIGGVMDVLMKKAGVEMNTGLFICVCIVVAVRILSKRNRLRLPEV